MRLLSDSAADIRHAAAAIADGRLVAFPTETVYGLGGDAFNPAALARIFEVKRRPRFDPLIVHIASVDRLGRVADISRLAFPAREMLDCVIKTFWPGPLTVILPKQPELPELATSGLATVAVRFPSHKTALELIRLSTGAVAAPSANLFGCLSPTRAEHVAAQIGDEVDYIIDGGRTDVGLESTVLDLSSQMPVILRPGGIPAESIEEIIGPLAVAQNLECQDAEDASGIISPGQLKSHYAPRIPLFLHESRDMLNLPYNPSEAFVFFSGISRDAWLAAHSLDAAGASSARALSETGSLLEAAANLFETLHSMDGGGFSAIRAERVPSIGLGAAINDRLSRASS